MQILRDLILIGVPPVMLGLAIFYLLRQYLVREENQSHQEMRMERLRLVNPLRFQAYERMVLLLERITPSQLIMRNNVPGGNAREMHQALISNIRQEFDHNLSQQLYISSNAWELIKNAREGVVSAINTSASQLKEDATSTDLARLILQDEMEGGISTIYKALEFLKEEARQIF